MKTATFDWSHEVDQVVTKSLITTFALDFLLLEDKKGGDVNTIHNVRQDIYATDKEKQRYEQREQYNSNAYHRHQNYINRGREDKILQQEGDLQDTYRNETLAYGQKRDLDHVIAAKEIHEDAGRILAELDGVDLANQNENLKSTTASINRSKQHKTIDEFIERLPESIRTREERLDKLNRQLENMPRDTPKQQQAYRELEGKIANTEQSLKEFQEINPEKMKEVDRKARAHCDEHISRSYYASSKFFGQTIQSALNTGFRMGTRQMIGLVLAEIWFELKDQIPSLLKKYKEIEFRMLQFFEELKQIVINIFERVKERFKDMLDAFKEGMLSGILSSVMTTILNIFLTTTKFWGRIIRETWLQIIQITKLVFFNPENLSSSQLVKATFKLLFISIGTVTGVMVNNCLVKLNSIPFGSEISIFLSALSSGFVILGLNYFMETSPIMQNLWGYLDRYRTKYESTLAKFREINDELDRYLIELTKLEFGVDIATMENFVQNLQQITDEMERNILLKGYVGRQKIQLPFEMGSKASTESWLLSLCDK